MESPCLTSLMNSDMLSRIVTVIIIVVIIAAALYVFWPLLLILAAYVGIKVFQYRRALKKAEQKIQEEQPAGTYQDQLFTQQADRVRREAEEAEVIDVEFTRKEDGMTEEGKRS